MALTLCVCKNRLGVCLHKEPDMSAVRGQHRSPATVMSRDVKTQSSISVGANILLGKSSIQFRALLLPPVLVCSKQWDQYCDSALRL